VENSTGTEAQKEEKMTSITEKIILLEAAAKDADIRAGENKS